MPVRKIPKNHVSVTGRHATSKSVGDADFESPLENDYLTLLDFDPSVERYEVQAVRVPVPGVPRGYVPDVLVHYRADPFGKARPSELTEVKSAEDFRKNSAKYAMKFAAAASYAEDRGWKFVRKSNTDIRTPRLKNLKFLRAYRHINPPSTHIESVLTAIRAAGGRTSSNRLISASACNDRERAELLPALWHLVVTGQVGTDLDVAFAQDVDLWLPGVSP